MKVSFFEVRLVFLFCVGFSQMIVSGFSHSLLAYGDDAVLVAPEANFRAELRRMKFPPPPFQAVDTTSYQNSAAESANLEQEDLRSAMRRAGKSGAEAERIISEALSEREKVLATAGGGEPAADRASDPADETGSIAKTAEPILKIPNVHAVPGLPDEFNDYLQGTAAWRDSVRADKTQAREAWERILSRPPEKRHFKSIPAAFMLGQSWEKESPIMAIEYYRKVRAFANEGFSDSQRLAAASLGQEARVYLNQTNYERAIDLYLQQMAAGDQGAVNSLCFTMRRLVRNGTNEFAVLARSPRACRVVTAYIISTRALQISIANESGPQLEGEDLSNHLASVVGAWLVAAEEANIKDPGTVEELALAAYQNGQWQIAQTWINRARTSPTAQWLQAKLLFREGKTKEAAARLESIARFFPIGQRGGNEPVELKDNLSVWDRNDFVGNHMLGELGVVYLARGRYAEALDNFMYAGFWPDAAYVAERVLTVDELKAYVDRRWPERTEESFDHANTDPVTDNQPDPRQAIRYLLARRLTREIRGNEAREYYPAEWQPQFDALVQALTNGWNEALPAIEQAAALFTAAQITRTNGMELIGTEVWPDWHAAGGDWITFSAELRTNANLKIVPASRDELRRSQAHRPDPDMRFHYRYQAAFLGLAAAKLMPNDSDETARILCTSGSWLKARDPETADIFYKALVRRCRGTELGDAADRLRWFPRTDDAGNLAPPPEPESSAPSEDQSGEVSAEIPM